MRPSKAKWLFVTCWLVAIAGCQAPAGRIAGCDPRTAQTPRLLVDVRQVLCDSALETTHHPLRTGLVLARDPVDCLDSGLRGIFGKRLLMRLLGPPLPLPETLASFPDTGLAGHPCLVGAGLQPAHIDLYPDGGEALAALERVIAGATCRINVLMFTWDHFALGKEVAARIAARASPKLRVRILVDGGANLLFGVPSEAPTGEINAVVCWLARQPHVELIRTRNPFGRHDHRKLVLADGQIAWSGGRNFTERAFFCRRDVSYTLTGPLVCQLQERFDSFWKEQGGAPAEPLPAQPDLAIPTTRAANAGPVWSTMNPSSDPCGMPFTRRSIPPGTTFTWRTPTSRIML